jgi:hypothetical protein
LQHVHVLRLPSLRQCLQLHLLHLWEFGVLTPAQVDLCLRIVDGAEEPAQVEAGEAKATLPPRQSAADAGCTQVDDADGQPMAVEQAAEARAAV